MNKKSNKIAAQRYEEEEEDGRWKMEDGRWKMEDGRWEMEDRK